jgi:hypothetical protein
VLQLSDGDPHAIELEGDPQQAMFLDPSHRYSSIRILGEIPLAPPTPD